MTSFDERQKGFERKFVHDQEMVFKAQARRNKLLGLWAAEKLGKQKDAAAEYATQLAITVIDERRKDIAGRVYFDLQKAGVNVTEKDVRVELERLQQQVNQELLGDKK
ncbi:MAG: DUF1476 domain-containing protein [Rickettsiales bacterium]|nr:DUF1476 domain-containing protein [Rickettsiales bacterium]